MRESHDSRPSDDAGRSAVPGEQDRSIPSPHAMMSEMSELVTSVGSSGAMHHPIFAKFEPEHVTQFLEHAHNGAPAT